MKTKIKKYIINVYTMERTATIEIKLGDVYIAHQVKFRFFPHFPFFTLIKLAAIIKFKKIIKAVKEFDYSERLASP